VEEEANIIQMEKLSVEQENRTLRDNNFELQSKSRAAETQAKRMQTEVADKEKQLRISTDQNSELLRFLESEEAKAVQLQSEVHELRSELDELRQKHGSLLTTAKTHEEMSTKAAREGQLRAEEIRLLRAETEQLKQQNSELKMKTQVEVEALQEQLRVRKEKQYQLLEKLQGQEEAKRQAEDQVTGMEEQLRTLHARNVELETQLQFEGRIKQNLEEANKELQFENNNVNLANKDLQIKIDKSEKERLRMEAEARDSADQLREMAEKVFQLLERLKLSELGKTKAMEALKKKELDMVALQKKNARLIKESTEEGRARVKAELDVKVLQDQVRTLKKHNTQVTQKSKEEATDKVKAQEECEQLREKITVTESRLSFLLNKVQADEEARVIQAEDRKKLEAQVLTLTSKCEELQHKLAEMGESNRIITQAMRLKQEELNDVSMKYEALVKENERRDANEDRGDSQQFLDMSGARIGAPDDIDNVRLNEGRGRFYVEVKSVGGGSMLLLRGRKPLYREWLERQGVNDFLKKAQKTTRFRDMIVEKMGSMYGLLMVEEEEKGLIVEQVVTRDKQIDHLQKKLSYIQDGLAAEEDAKRRMLLRYIHAVKEHAQNATDGIGGVLQLPESNISDEEIHALAALLRNNTSIEELNLRGNNITDDGARALAAVLSGKSGLRLVDLRGNKIGKSAIRILAEALERSERVRHVYVHAGGKIEALGTGKWATKTRATIGSTVDDNYSLESSAKQPVNVETICVVDIRDNNPAAATSLLDMDSSLDNVTSTSLIEASQGSSNYTPAVMLESSGAPPRSAHSNKRQQQTSEKTPHQNNSTNKTSPSKMEKKISKTEVIKIHVHVL
jgi:myosin protein heavy chain